MGEGIGARGRTISTLVVVGMIVLSACGARLTDQQRAQGIGLVSGGTGPGGVPTGVATTGPGGGSVGPGGGVIGPGGGATTGPVPSVAPTQPPGGNGGATDVGVTATKLTIATIADVSGVQPGLFKSAWQAMQALVAMQNSQGGVDGRLLDLLLLDSKVDSGATRRAVLDACPKAFAIVGSMSAFDGGGAEAVESCSATGIPDMTAITTSGARVAAKSTFPTYPNRPDYFIRGSAEYMAKTYPEAIKHAAQLYLNTSTTRNNAESKRKAYITAGFDFIYKAETNVLEANYTPYVQKMRDAGVQFVTMLSDWQSIQRLTDTMAKEKWYPQVMEWDSVVYTPKFLEQTQGSANNSFVYLNNAMFEEINQYPEMQLYAAWLARVAPGVKPDYFGLYAWSTGRLFIEQIRKVGPAITRAKLIESLKTLHSWDGNGLHAAHDIGNKLPSRCTMFAQIKNNAFVRKRPATGFDCTGALQKV
jgi:ABC-type branched-subunit amino acid transport system substrate-binding protein